MNNNPHFKTPKTFFIGQTEADLEGLLNYLEYTSNLAFTKDIEEAQKAGLSSGEILCSFYAKLCYASLTTEHNENISKVRSIADNLMGTITSGHGCYDIETEVYTRDGWKRWDEVTMDDHFLTLSNEGSCEFHKPKRIIKYHHEGDMVKYNGKVDLLVTGNHNIYCCKMTTINGRKKKFSDYSLVTADKLVGVYHSLIKCSPNKYINSNPNPVYQLLGFAIGDGYVYQRGNGIYLGFNLRKKRKIDYLNCILRKLNISCHIKAINLSKLGLVDLFKIYNDKNEKIVPFELLHNINHENFSSLYDGLINSDGCVHRTGVVFDTTSQVLAGQIQFIANVLGIGSSISQAKCYKERRQSYGDKEIYRLYLMGRNIKPEVNKGRAGGTRSEIIKNWSGNVFCAEVKNNTLFVRRNGAAVWCGNSIFSHVMLNFVVSNCSRIFTHEMVRHGIGTAFSQESGRYVRKSSLDLVIDPCLAPVAEEIENLRGYIEVCYDELVMKLGLTQDIPFSQKKKLTSALRRILPNGQTNEFGFSINLRALRHVIELRTSHHAEWEIRLIFNQVYDLVKEKYPMIFFDAQVKEIEGLNEITFLNKKI